MRTYIIYTFVFIFLLVSNIGICGPFGTDMNDTPQKYGKEYDEKYNSGKRIITTENPPKRHPLLKSYDLKFNEGKLYSVMAFSTNNPFKEDYKDFEDAFKDYTIIYNQLKAKYGAEDIESEKLLRTIKDDTIRQFAIWNNNDNQLPDNLKSVSIELSYYPSLKYTIRLVYTYKNDIGWIPYHITHPKDDGSESL